MKQWYVYILASQRNGTLYVGVTNDIARRVGEHKTDAVDGFTKKYHVHLLVYYETYGRPADAIRREKNIKAWRRQWNLRAIEEMNPEWNDLAYDLFS